MLVKKPSHRLGEAGYSPKANIFRFAAYERAQRALRLKCAPVFESEALERVQLTKDSSNKKAPRVGAFLFGGTDGS